MHNDSNERRNAQWHSRPLEDIAWVEWGQDHIAYHRPSGVTHFLNASSKLLITELLREPKGAIEVTKAFGVSEGDTDWPVRFAEMRAMLGQLEHLGFIERL